jgi:hypothetical protein
MLSADVPCVSAGVGKVATATINAVTMKSAHSALTVLVLILAFIFASFDFINSGALIHVHSLSVSTAIESLFSKMI